MPRALLAIDGPRPPALNMALDTAMMRYAARTGTIIIRIYRWSPPAVSLGRSQPEAEARTGLARSLGFQVVRRPTGGRGIVHLPRDLTYSVAAPRGTVLHDSPVEEAASIVARAVAGALSRSGIPAESPGPRPYRPGGPICLLAEGSADILVGARKVGGAALMRSGEASMMHGTILVEHRPTAWLSLLRHTPEEARLFQERVAGLEALTTRPLGGLARLLGESIARALGAEPVLLGLPAEVVEEAEEIHSELYIRGGWLITG